MGGHRISFAVISQKGEKENANAKKVHGRVGNAQLKWESEQERSRVRRLSTTGKKKGDNEGEVLSHEKSHLLLWRKMPSREGASMKEGGRELWGAARADCCRGGTSKGSLSERRCTYIGKEAP